MEIIILVIGFVLVSRIPLKLKLNKQIQGRIHVTYSSSFLLTMMTSSNGNILHVTGHFCGEFKGQWRRALMFSLICSWINGWVNNRKAGDLRRHRAHYDVIVMQTHIRSSRGVSMASSGNFSVRCLLLRKFTFDLLNHIHVSPAKLECDVTGMLFLPILKTETSNKGWIFF